MRNYTISEYITILGEAKIIDGNRAIWSNGKNTIGGRFKVAKNKDLWHRLGIDYVGE